MSLTLPAGAACFVDANIFYYHFVNTAPYSDPCSEFLKRVAASEVIAYTSINAPAETVHKVMLAEAVQRFGLTRAGLVSWLQKHQEQIGLLDAAFEPVAKELAASNLRLIKPDLTTLVEGTRISRALGLLTNDALSVALMAQTGLTDLVTNDADFSRVHWLTLWKP